jgi:uroporphyrinogen decarboxylase
MTLSTKPLLRVLKGENRKPQPLWLMRQAGRYLPEYRALREKLGGFLDLCYAPESAAAATLQPVKRFGFDAAILFSDILLVPQALGQELWFAPGEGPRLAPIRSAAEAAALQLDGLTQRLAPVYRAAALVAKELGPETALIGFAGSPWTLATYMVEGGPSQDFARVTAWAEQDPSGFDILIDRLVEAVSLHLAAQAEAGAEAVQLFDTWAGIVPPGQFERLVLRPTRRIIERLRSLHPDLPMIGFPRGIGPLYPRYFAETGVTALSIDASVALDFAAEHLQPLGPVQGNLDPRLLLTGGEELERGVAAILAALGKGPLVFNLGHGVLPETPPAHVERLVALIRHA